MELVPIHSDSGCPSPEAVQAEVRELTTLQQRQAVPADAKVVVRDRGESLSIAITRDGKTNVRSYQDAARDCERRAHFVSVLVVVSLMPPDLGSPDAPPEAPPEPETPPPPQARAPAPSIEPAPSQASSAEATTQPKRVSIELAGKGELSTPISDSVRAASLGGSLGVALGRGSTRLTLELGYAPRAKLEYTGASAGQARIERADVTVGLRVRLLEGPLATSIEAAAVVMRAEVGGESSRRPTQDTAFSAGARLGARFAVAEQRLVSPFLGVYSSVFPLAPALSQLPQGTVGHLPYVWLGLTGGLSLSL